MSNTLTPEQEKRLHPDIATHVVARFKHGFLDDAVLNAYKIIEEKLRAITGSYDADAMELIKQTFHPNTGLLTDPRLWPSEKDGFHQLLRGAFLTFRNSPAHRFTFSNSEEALDAIILANRLYITIDSSYKNRLSLSTQQNYVFAPIYASRSSNNNSLLLDVNEDGVDEILNTTFSPSGLTVEILNPSTRAVIDTIYPGGETIDIAMADVDNDGAKELACIIGYTAGSGLKFYRLTNGQFTALTTVNAETGQFEPALFDDAQLVDFDGDGKLEIISEPWDAIPQDLWPKDKERELYDWGRVRYVYRWNSLKRVFDLLHRELLYVGGR